MMEPLPSRPFPGFRWTSLARCGTGAGGRRGQQIHGWAPFSEPFLKGEIVCLERKSNARNYHAEVMGPVFGPESGALAGMQAIRPLEVDDAGSTAIVEPRKMARVLPPTDPRVLLMADTTSFRRMAKTQVGLGDAVLEIGSALGACTRILERRAGIAVGVDLSEDLVLQARRLQPQCRFEWMDFFEEPARLDALWSELCGRGRLKIFVDIGGDRAAADVCRVLAALGGVAVRRPTERPALVVVKSRELAAAAEAAACDKNGVLVAPDTWWAQVARPYARSQLQAKRKHSRGRRAMWAFLTGGGGGASLASSRGGLSPGALIAWLATPVNALSKVGFGQGAGMGLWYGVAGLLAGLLAGGPLILYRQRCAAAA